MYEPDSCSPLSKVFYRPIDAAIRWCNLLNHESQILDAPWYSPASLASIFPLWPCLHTNLELILDAVNNNDLNYGALGVPVAPGTPVDCRMLTIRHTDLKQWMLHYHPDQRPSFLFSQPTNKQETINYKTYLILQADRDALLVQLKTTEAKLQSLTDELKAAGVERENLRMLAQNNQRLDDHSRTSFLNVIGALVNIMLGSSMAGRKHSIFDSQASIVDSITAHYGGIAGLNKRSLDEKFAAGRRSLAHAKN